MFINLIRKFINFLSNLNFAGQNYLTG